MKKKRADELLHALGLSESRTKAQALIMAGEVSYSNAQNPHWQLVKKSGQTFSEETQFKLLNEGHAKDVGRGAQKLRHALEVWPFVDTKVSQALDIGSSTGGFTQVLLEKGAARVIALDVGTHQLHEKLRADPRVLSVENQHVLRMGPAEWKGLGVEALFKLIVTDLSFISLTKIIKHVLPWLDAGAMWIMLIKPQFELTPKKVPGGIVKNKEFHLEAVNSVKQAILETAMPHSKLIWRDVIESPIKGGSGNVEFLALVECVKLETPTL